MDDSNIEWKEAKGGQEISDSEDEELYTKNTHQLKPNQILPMTSDNEDQLISNKIESQSQFQSDNFTFKHQNLLLNLKRNITALGDPKYHKAKPTYSSDKNIPFDSWLENALVAISPTADLILFSGQIPNKITFFAKLRMEPINQYVTKPLDLPLDYDEHVTSLSCLPIMSTQKTALGLIDWTALVVGLSSGYIKFYTEQNICLLSLKFSDETVLNLKCQTQKTNLNGKSDIHFPTISDEFMIIYKTFVVIIDGITLYENLRLAKNEVIKSNSTYEPAYNLTNLPTILNCQKWLISDSRNEPYCDAELLGSRKSCTFDSLVSESINLEHVPTKSFGRALVFVGKNPFISIYKESNDTTSHSYTEIIGSLFSLWNKPQPSPVQMIEITKYNNISMCDRDRFATSIVPSPDKRLAAITDDFGRVLLMDCTNWLVVRIWKGYRSAQCGWIEVKRNPDKRICPQASFLVIYAPKRGLLEVWSTQRGPRVVAFNVGKHCRLLYSGYKMLNMRAEKSNASINQPVEQSYSGNCYLLNAKSETIFSIEVPYTYSLYKYGDLKSRDHLLIGELNQAIQNDSEVDVVSEILHRIALPESLQVSIHRIVSSFLPTKILPIMENLINKTMKNYDNHSGETMTHDDLSIIELCKRVIRLCSMFTDLSQSAPHDISFSDVNSRLIEQYEEHPEEIDEFSKELNWSSAEVLRYLSLLSLERSYSKSQLSSPWPSLGEPLSWSEFISCFDLTRTKNRRRKRGKDVNESWKNTNDVLIRLKQFRSDFINQDKVAKTALFMYNRLSENFYKGLQSSTCDKKKTTGAYNYLDPSSRLGLLFQFWLSSKLCNHWRMWLFLQDQVGQISDELKVIAMDRKNDTILIESWKQIYNLILESDNIFAALTATATIKSDTLRMIADNEKREKLEAKQLKEETTNDPSSIDWECLCIDAERMSLLSQQLEDVFLLNLLLRYSIKDGYLKDNHYVYKVPRISVANVLKGGPTIVTELVAQWAVQSDLNLKIFTQPYGQQYDEDNVSIVADSSRIKRRNILSINKSPDMDNEEHAKELLHHTITSFPLSLEQDVILVYSIWELCRCWTNNNFGSTIDKTNLLHRAYGGISLLKNLELKHKLTSAAYKTFFKTTLERLVVLLERNASLVSVKNSKSREGLIRKELNIGEECLEKFVQYCCDFSELMLQTCSEQKMHLEQAQMEDKANIEKAQVDESIARERLLSYDNWWSTPNIIRIYDKHRRPSSSSEYHENVVSLMKTILSTQNLLDIDSLVELNRLANLLNLIFELKITKAYPISLLGEECRKLLKLDLQQSPNFVAIQTSSKSKPSSLNELRQKFVRRCILNIVNKMIEENGDFNEEDEESRYGCDNVNNDNRKTGLKVRGGKKKSQQESPFIVDKQSNKSNKSKSSRGGLELKPASSKNRSNRRLSHEDDNNVDDAVTDEMDDMSKLETNKTMILFANLLSLAKDWEMNCDELHLEFVFELYRCNLDAIASQISSRVFDKQTLASGLLKISSQRVLVLFGLSPNISESSRWMRRVDIWSRFQPNISNWLKTIQQEEIRREIASLSFSQCTKVHDASDTLMSNDEDYYEKQEEQEADTDYNDFWNKSFGLQLFVLRSLRHRTRIVLEGITNYLDGQAERLAYDLLELLDSYELKSCSRSCSVKGEEDSRRDE